MNSLIIISTFILFYIIELFYFKIADHYNIIDKPNHRSSHSTIVLRGGGIIFVLGLLLYPFYYGWEQKYFLMGLFLIALISFADDINPVKSRVRIMFHITSVALLFFQVDLFNLPWIWIIPSLIFVIGSINAINFMDGINGITGLYGLITLLTLLYINNYIVSYIEPNLILTAIISVIIFLYFNFRKFAKCFAGDVGSVSIAFIILFLILTLIIKTNNFSYLLLLLLYGLDTSTTILFRLYRKENIFDAHRSHFYQFWANEKKSPHLIVASVYSLVQLIINVVVIFFVGNSLHMAFIVLFTSIMLFLTLRFRVEGPLKILGH